MKVKDFFCILLVACDVAAMSPGYYDFSGFYAGAGGTIFMQNFDHQVTRDSYSYPVAHTNANALAFAHRMLGYEVTRDAINTSAVKKDTEYGKKKSGCKFSATSLFGYRRNINDFYLGAEVRFDINMAAKDNTSVKIKAEKEEDTLEMQAKSSAIVPQLFLCCGYATSKGGFMENTLFYFGIGGAFSKIDCIAKNHQTVYNKNKSIVPMLCLGAEKSFGNWHMRTELSANLGNSADCRFSRHVGGVLGERDTKIEKRENIRLMVAAIYHIKWK
ncbi:MAG: hypothetical protein LBF57_02495 [Holosporaceae bacterium]|nr:hypothetical protein [Holosporaceae bacterium]